MSEYTPVKATKTTVFQSFSYAQLFFRAENTDQFGTPLTVEIAREFDCWLEEVKATGAKAERTRIFDFIEHEANDLIAKGDAGSETHVMLGKLADLMSREVANG